jgi:hypothetical protein
MITAIDLPAMGFSALYLVLGLVIAASLKRLQVTDSVGLVALLVLPLITYGVASGSIAKITGPGGLSAEFVRVAEATVKPTPLAEEVQDLSIIEKGGIREIQQYRDTLERGKPVAISLRLGRFGYYNRDVIAEYIRAFLTFDPNLTVIFLDDASGRFVASSNANSVLAALTLRDGDGGFVDALGANDLSRIESLIVLTTNFVTAETTNAEALRMMADDGVDAVVKTDPEGIAVGLVRRDQIMSGLMLGLAKG